VHWSSGRQTVKTSNDWAYVQHQNCLGADCTTGVWLMLEMIKAGVEGLYIFHRDEENGGKGSTHIRDKTPELLDGIKYAIAFDRYGYKSIITHQFGKRTASDKFADSLKYALEWDGLEFKHDDGGTFTDTEVYSDLIPECTNISVGYFDQHSSKESQDLEFAFRLRDTLVEADFTQLVCDRDPTAEEYDAVWIKSFRSTDYAYSTKGESDYTYTGEHGGGYAGTSDGEPAGSGDFISKVERMVNGRAGRSNYDSLVDLCRTYPEAVANILDQYGISYDEIVREYDATGWGKAA
jgi:hypothetical protein